MPEIRSPNDVPHHQDGKIVKDMAEIILVAIRNDGTITHQEIKEITKRGYTIKELKMLGILIKQEIGKYALNIEKVQEFSTIKKNMVYRSTINTTPKKWRHREQRMRNNRCNHRRKEKDELSDLLFEELKEGEKHQ